VHNAAQVGGERKLVSVDGRDRAGICSHSAQVILATKPPFHCSRHTLRSRPALPYMPKKPASAARPDPRWMLEQAFALHQQNRLGEAEPLYAAVLKQKPDDFDALHLLGLLNMDCGRLPEALRLIGAALRANARSADALANYGLVLQQLGRYQEALAAYDKALALRPAYAEVLNNRGNALKRLGRLDQALAAYQRALAHKPDYVDALYNHGTALLDLGRTAEALADFGRVLALKPGHAETLANRGSALLKLSRPEDALASFEAALARQPDRPEVISNCGCALLRLARYEDALACFQRALTIDANHADAHFNEGVARLMLGDFRAGWRKYQWRWETKDFAKHRRDFAAPLWLGDEPIVGKTILLHAEQGFGDAIQFVRYAPLVARRGAKVVLELHPGLEPLLANLDAVAQVVTRGEALPPHDLQCPLMSLPLALRTERDTIPWEGPYIAASPQQVELWRQRLPPAPRIGLAWSGRPTHDNDLNRSLALETLAPLLELPGLHWVSLQRHLHREAASTLGNWPSLVHFGEELDFANTAAVVSLVDLVISVDTAVAHLAGAMGKPVWIMLSQPADFRWMEQRSDTPWYPTARLFRQPRLGDWASVIARVADELCATGIIAPT
jgi:tetratricopeptide (TPR) repeat protein